MIFAWEYVKLKISKIFVKTYCFQNMFPPTNSQRLPNAQSLLIAQSYISATCIERTMAVDNTQFLTFCNIVNKNLMFFFTCRRAGSQAAPLLHACLRLALACHTNRFPASPHFLLFCLTFQCHCLKNIVNLYRQMLWNINSGRWSGGLEGI